MNKLVFKIFRLAFFIALVAGALLTITASADTPSIQVLRVEGTIVPIVADYIDRGISAGGNG